MWDQPSWTILHQGILITFLTQFQSPNDKFINLKYKLLDATANYILSWHGGNKVWKEVTAEVIRTLHRALPESLQHSLDLLKSNDTLLNILGPDLSTVYKAVKESMLKLESSIDEEVMDDFNKA